jgi:hypothetical protein
VLQLRLLAPGYWAWNLTSHEIREGRSGTGTGFSPSFFDFPLLIIIPPVTVAERSSLARKPGSWVQIPLRAWMFSVCVCVCLRFSVFVYKQRSYDELITHPRSSTDCLRSRKPKWNREFHGGRQGPNWSCSAKVKKKLSLHHWSILNHHRLLRCGISLIRQRIIISSVSKLETSSPTRNFDGSRDLCLCVSSTSRTLM